MEKKPDYRMTKLRGAEALAVLEDLKKGPYGYSFDVIPNTELENSMLLELTVEGGKEPLRIKLWSNGEWELVVPVLRLNVEDR